MQWFVQTVRLMKSRLTWETGLWNHLGDWLLGKPVNDLLITLIDVGKLILTVGGIIPWGDPGLYKMEKTLAVVA